MTQKRKMNSATQRVSNVCSTHQLLIIFISFPLCMICSIFRVCLCSINILVAFYFISYFLSRFPSFLTSFLVKCTKFSEKKSISQPTRHYPCLYSALWFKQNLLYGGELFYGSTVFLFTCMCCFLFFILTWC